ncbi:unnamed protein product [Rotaria sordida]|uniref:Uncharacterized protein n=1 Tax=Rotaria sordida TaxID=392033 RepID=A0A814DCE9_9BILA|nr:unnamed protein product [Rotaria sordida]CAF1540376.1 unnamed protein product [Rotaria sordida]
MLSRDNPNVNKTVENIINEAMKKVGAELLNIDPCNLHIIHNGFKADPSLRTESDSADQMIRIGRSSPKLLSDSEIDCIRHEFMMYATETIDESWHIKTEQQENTDFTRQF